MLTIATIISLTFQRIEEEIKIVHTKNLVHAIPMKT